MWAVTVQQVVIEQNSDDGSDGFAKMGIDRQSRVDQEGVDPDEVLMQKIIAKDHDAFTTLVNRHFHRFYSLAFRMLSNKQESQDAVQEVFLKLWNKAYLWQQDRNTKFSTWFYRVVINQCLDQRKKKQPQYVEDLSNVIVESSMGQDQLIEYKRKQQWLEKNIKGLPKNQQIALNLCFYEGLSNQEAAEIMGLRIKAVQSLVMRAKTSLRNKIFEKGHP